MIQYLKERGFDQGAIKEWGLEPKDKEVIINYLDREGKPLYQRTNRPGRDPKYLSPAGSKTQLYGLHMLKYIDDELLLIEGEYNAISAWYMGYKALGVAGQSMKLKDYQLENLPKTLKKITILYDNKAFALQRAKEILQYFDYEVTVYIASYMDGKDANDYFKEDRAIEFKAIMNVADKYVDDYIKREDIKVNIPSNDFIEVYKQYALEISDAPEKYQELMALSLIATVLKRQVYKRHGVYNLYPNLFIVLLGKSTIMRKTACLNMAKRILMNVNEELILPNEFSPEALFNVLAENPTGLISWSEFGAFLSGASAKSYQSGIKEFFTDAYDCPSLLKKKLVNKEYRIEDLYLNIITASTIHWLIDRISESDALGGFLGRFIYMPCKKSDKNGWKYLPGEEDIKLKNDIVSRLNKISQLKGEVILTPAADSLFLKWAIRHDDDIDAQDDTKGIIGFYGRLADYVLKFAMLYEISGTMSLEISEGSMLRAIKLTNLLKNSINELLSDHIAFTKEAKDMQKVLNIIRPDGTITRAKLLQNSNMTARQLDDVLITLIQRGQLYESYEVAGKKRTKTYTITA